MKTELSLAILKERQSWSFNQKYDHAMGVIEQFIGYMGKKHVFVSFSGGKDSTVMLDMVRKFIPDVPVIFANTGNEFPENVKFCRSMKDKGINFIEVHPKMTMKQVIETVGFPIISKEVCSKVNYYLKYPEKLKSNMEMGNWRLPYRYQYLLNAPYQVSDKCCLILKERPITEWGKKNKSKPFIGTRAEESKRRSLGWVVSGGCNIFTGSNISSRPLSIWLKEDVNEYIKQNNLEISPLYSQDSLPRTGCVMCGFGCTFDGRISTYKLLKERYPKYYDLCMNFSNNGYTYQEVMEELGKRIHKKILP